MRKATVYPKTIISGLNQPITTETTSGSTIGKDSNNTIILL